MAKYSELKAEKQRLEAEQVDIQERTDREASRYLEESAQLEREYQRLAEEIKAIKSRYAAREEAYRAQVEHKKAELQSLRRVIEISRTAQESLSKEVAELRQAATHLARAQIRTIHRAKELCTEHLTAAIQREVSEQTRDETERLASLRAALATEHAECERNQQVCRQLLDAVWTIRDGIPHPDITPLDFASRLPELKAFVEDALNYHGQAAIDELKYEVKKRIPDLDFGDDPVVVAVQKYISRKVQQKERDYQLELKRGEERERRLRERLKESLGKMHQVEEVESDPSDDGLLVELDQMKREWDLRRRQLDEKMRELKTVQSPASTKMMK
jgi:hypothetical protein